MRALACAGLLALVASPLAAAAPEQVHLGLPDSDPSAALSVLWMDLAPGAAALRLEGPGGPREVQGALVPGPSPGFVFDAALRDLAPGASYTYTLGGRSFAFTAPPRASSAEGFTFVALGDMGVTPQSRATLQAVQQLAPDFILHAGDISYAEGDPLAWKAWFDLVEPVAATRPWIVALGNHETYSGGVASAGAASPEIALFRQRFGLPGNELWYSFDWAGVHVVALDTFSGDAATLQGPLADEELAWLERDLAAHAGAPWTLAFLHEPAYSSNAAHGSSARVQQALVPILERHGVDLVIQAHDHGYERTQPLRGGASAQGGTVYVTTGGGGQSLYTTWQQPTPSWSAARAAIYHVLSVRVTPDAIEGRVVPTAGDAFTETFRIDRAGGAPLDLQPRPAPALDAAPLALAAVAVLALRRRRA